MTTSTTSGSRPGSRPVLRGEGVGPFDFGSDAKDVETWLVEEFGDVRTWDEAREPLVGQVNQVAGDPAAAVYPADVAYPAEGAYRRVIWANGLEAVFSDAGHTGVPEELAFVAWRYAPAGVAPMPYEIGPEARELTTLTGIAPGTALEQLAASYPGYTMDDDGPCDDAHAMTAFEFELRDTGTEESGIRGHPTWGVGYVGTLEAGVRPSCTTDRAPPPPAPTSPVDTRLTLNPDGLGPFPLDAQATELTAFLVSTFGPAQLDHGEIRAEPIDGPYGVELAQRHLEWFDLGLTLDLSDAMSGNERSTAPGPLRLVAWHSGPRLATEGGSRVGGPIGVVLDEFDDVRFGSDCDGEAGWEDDARWFSIGPDPWRFYGRLEPWDVVAALQERLNVAGADLVVDGIFGNLTQAALEAFKKGHSLGDDPVPDRAVLHALGVQPPRDTQILSLAGRVGASPCGGLEGTDAED